VPVRVYVLRPEAVAALPVSSLPPAASISQPGVAPRLSIVVLPFTNLSDDREQQYFADGITEDLTTDLSRIADMLVISRSSAFTYKDKPANAKQIGRELCVRYVLEGSVRRSGNRFRVNAQLIDAGTDAHVWAERFDGYTGDLFTVQDEITSRIAVALDLELVGAEAARPTEHPDALDYILRGRAITTKPRTRDNWAEMISLFEHALALDPRSIDAQSWLANALTSRALDQMADSAAADMARAEGLAGQALAASPRSLLGHYAKAQVLRAQGRYKEAIPEYETAIAINRNWVGAIAHLGQCKLFTGSIEETIPPVEKAIRVSPRDGQIPSWYWRIGVVHLVQSRLDEAIRWFEKARGANPGRPAPPRLARLFLCPQRRLGPRRRRTRRSPEAEQRRSLFEYCPAEGRRIFRGGEGPRLVRNHFLRRPAQGRSAGGMNGSTVASARMTRSRDARGLINAW
jgi:TolB-like protein/Tfp pilus assembly protein PilF